NWKTRFLDLRESCDSQSDAEQEAQRYLDQHLWPRPTGTLSLKGEAQLANGHTIPALHIRPGMMVRNTDSEFEAQLIEHVSGRLREREVTLTIG
ncbi:hypothetical protein M2T55_36235, partial [Klebsiella pneumoniae]|nr:hypothetical protein [Klebsiella pneumoniae]